jgi:chloramphenicol-sensitive protein RarD
VASTRRQGLLFGVAAYLSWGLFPLYWPLLEPASALEILACRILFSLVVVAALLAVRGELVGVRRLGRVALVRLSVAGAFIAVNWGAYIWGVNHHHVVETSLGYFINPLVTVALGVVVLHERLRRVQWWALGLGAVAVVVLSVDYGRPPWLALLLALSFGSYGLIKKQVGVGAAAGLTVESAVLAGPALVLMIVLTAQGTATYHGHGAGHVLLLVGAGLVTAIPLLFFAGAASRLPLSTLGLLQYLTPMLQFLVGVLIRHEPLPPGRLAGFALVWAALVVLSVDGLRHRAGQAGPAVVTEPVSEDVLSPAR